jgi:hypothetical protein
MLLLEERRDGEEARQRIAVQTTWCSMKPNSNAKTPIFVAPNATNAPRHKNKWPPDYSDGHVDFLEENALVCSNRATAAGFGGGDTLHFGEGSDAGVGHAIVVDHAAPEGVASVLPDGAGLAHRGVDPGFKRGTASGARYVHIAVCNAHRNGFVSGRGSNGRGCNGSKSDQRKNKAHDNTPKIERGCHYFDAVSRHSVVI